jgi:phosphopantothenoylcysteine decarboxylase / phosphopantothenate---cysteine ligase
MDFSGKTIALAIAGGIAAYRACDLIRELFRQGVKKILPIMTPSAVQFIAPKTIEALARHPVFLDPMATELLNPEYFGVPLHIRMAQEADALVILPATADIIGKLAHGLADDPVTTTAITFTDKPILIVPAMNTRMWQNPLVTKNLATLEQYQNIRIVSPVSGLLACGETGGGHLASQEAVLRALYQALHPYKNLLKGQHAIITAGGTREPIDPVRVITNRSSGKMGLALADEWAAMGGAVTLITAQETPPVRENYPVIQVTTSQNMAEALEEAIRIDLLPAESSSMEFLTWVIMAAAVSDFKVKTPALKKLKRESTATLTLELTATQDLLAEQAAKKTPRQRFIGFAAESEQLHEHAMEKLARKNLDAIVANDISRSDIGFESDENEVTVFFREGDACFLPRAPKSTLAKELLHVLYQRLKPL